MRGQSATGPWCPITVQAIVWPWDGLTVPQAHRVALVQVRVPGGGDGEGLSWFLDSVPAARKHSVSL